MPSKKYMLLMTCVLAAYHTMAGMLVTHIDMPRWVSLVNFGLVPLWGCALLVYVWVRVKESGLKPAAQELTSEWINWFFCLLAIFYVLTWVSVLIQTASGPAAFADNLGMLFNGGICFFVLCPLGYWFGLRKDDRFFNGLIDATTAVFVVMLLCAIWSVNSQTTVLSNWAKIEDGRLVMGAHPNFTGMTCAMLIMAGMYRFLKGNRWVKVLYVVAEVILFVGLSLSDSRASALAAAVGFAGVLGLLVWKRFGRGRSTWRMLLITVGVVVAGVAGFWYVRNLGAAVATDGVAVRKMLGDALGGGSGRIPMWQCIVTEILPSRKDIMLFGTSPWYVEYVLAEYHGTVEKFGGVANTHNMLLEIAMGCGLPALGVFVAWLVMLARSCWKIGTASFDKIAFADRILPLLLLVLIVNNMLEARLLFNRFVMSSVFFLMAGYIYGCSIETKEK